MRWDAWLAYTEQHMARRMLAFALSLMVIGAPMATDLCQAACAMRSADATSHSAGAEHHSCHAEAPSSGQSLTALHVCGHTDQLPGVDRPEQGMATLAIMPALAVAAPAIEAALAGIAPAQFASPPRTALASPLRV